MNVALIFAGGVGSRMNAKSKPKQFLELNGKPIIIHTIEHFENHPEIDGICVVCLEEWISHLKGLLEKFVIKKAKWIVPGGKTGQDSIFNGLSELHEECKNSENTVVLIHDGVRPLINEALIHQNIESVRERGSAITVSPAIETIVSMDEREKIQSITDRKRCFLARAPQSFYLEDIYAAHLKMQREGVHDMIDSASLMKSCGHELFSVEGPVENIKITTPMDFYLFRALYEAKENSQIFGF